jgi:formylglycine-generating enzyme required for sulfatase activity
MLDQLSERAHGDALPVPGGRYVVGDPAGGGVEVELGAFRMSSRPVTNEEFVAFMAGLGLRNHVDGTYLCVNDVISEARLRQTADGEYLIHSGYERHPVVGVTWYGAALFSLAVGGRLPTEAGWEVAARGGAPRAAYPWGARAPEPSDGNFAEYVGDTTPSGAYAANGLGFLDMAGNVSQWCLDWYVDGEPYPVDREMRVAEELRSMRVARGAAWNKGPWWLACHARRGKWPRMGSRSCGFRVVFPDVPGTRWLLEAPELMARYARWLGA